MAGCIGCGDDCVFGGKKVGSKGPIDSPIVIVGESPGYEELAKGIPFIGPSGKLLEQVLAKYPNVQPYITNAIHCFPRAKDPSKMVKATSACHNRLIDEIKSHPRKVILALGNAALWSLTGNYNLKITQERGKVFASELAENGIVASVHPAFLLRGGGNIKKFYADIEYALSLSTGGELKEFQAPTHTVIRTDDDWREMLAKLRTADFAAADIETSGLRYRRDRILCLGVCVEPNHAYVIPPDFLCHTQELFDIPTLRWIWHNGKFDVKFFHHHYYDVEARVDEDTMLLSYALDETRGIHDLDQVALDHIGAPNHKDMIKPYLPKKDSSYELVPEDLLYKYLAFDLVKTFRVFKKIRPQVAADAALEKLYTRTLIPASTYLAEIEKNGLLVDTGQVDKNREVYGGKATQYAAALNEISRAAQGFDINPNSPKQVAELLYDVLGIPTRERSTAEDVLKNLPKHPAIDALLLYRENQKALSTYVDAIPGHVNDDGRVHPTYLIHGTVTGRLACREPNLQNIPREADLRGQFVASPGNRYLEVDLSQAELRSLACLSGDPDLCYIYENDGLSLHDEVATHLFGKDFTEEHKVKAKNVNFGIVYGVTCFTLAEKFLVSHREAQSWIDGWFKRFPKAKEFIDRCRGAPVRGQSMVTVFGRKKRFGLVTRERLNGMQNEAANFPHQSSASDITLQAGIEMWKELEDRWNAKIVNTVHDSILIELRDDDELCGIVARHVINTIEGVPIKWGLTRVPFKADAKIGTRWGHLQKYKVPE